MYGVVFKAGVLPIGTLAPAGVRILGALDGLARQLQHTLTVTCADKAHGPTDEHTLGEAFDVRTHDLGEDTKQALLHELLIALSDNASTDVPKPVVSVSMPNLATQRFYAQLENHGQPDEHIHVQRRKHTVYQA
jgi:hypothetical protein